MITHSRVPPFGYLWLNARFQLTIAFRRIPRPSSPLTAKASTVCAFLLDHIISINSIIVILNRLCYLFYHLFNELLAYPDHNTLALKYSNLFKPSLNDVALVEPRRIELLTPCVQGRCSPS
jgi:hypothetical protein